ncbi:MAG: paraquat-inducible protein A [Neisseriaceae bacterium]|nr:paraquat-inducible protein A [Neisseriaceae bacterium]
MKNHTHLPSENQANILGCPECGTAVRAMAHIGETADCPTCGRNLIRIENNPYLLPILYAITALAVLIPVSFGFFMSVRMPTVSERLTLPGMMYALLRQDYSFLANAMFLLTFATPLFFLILLLYVLGAFVQNKNRPFLLPAARWLFRLKQWLMVDIFAISSLVALIKIRVYAEVEFGLSFYAVFIYALILARLSQSITPNWLFSKASQLSKHKININNQLYTTFCHRCFFKQSKYHHRCSICGTFILSRRNNSLTLSTAFLLAAMICYIPANLLPMMITSDPTVTVTSQIFDGVLTLWSNKDYLVAVIIFTASIAVPLLKIVGMIILLLSAKFKLPTKISAHKLSLLHRFIELVGRWSMIDIFVTIILMAAFSTPIAKVTAGPASIYFTLVVVLTMLSTYFFDTRILWQKEQEKQ